MHKASDTILEKKVYQIYGGRTLPPTVLAGTDLNSGFMPVQRVFYFAGRPDVTRLQKSLGAALALWPDFAGTVIRHKGTLAIDRNDTGVRMTVETFDAPVPAFGMDVPLGLPVSFCDEAISAKPDDGGPVFTVRISIYNDNHWILGTCNSHALCDGSGYWQLMRSWRDAFHGAALQEMHSDFMRYVARREVNPACASVPPHMKVPPVSLIKKQIANAGIYRTQQTLLSQQAIEQLKSAINASLAPDWVSSQDAVMALVWQSLAVVLLREGASGEQDFPLANVINIRPHLGLENYTGNMAYSVSSHATLADIAGASLSQLAYRLRQDSQQVNRDNIQEHLCFMQEQLDAGHYNTAGYFTGFSSAIAGECVHGKAVMINNWSKFPAYAMDFSCAPLWFDLATIIPMHFVMTMPSPDGVVIRLFLPDSQLSGVLSQLHEKMAIPPEI
jgi:hypothetical protein